MYDLPPEILILITAVTMFGIGFGSSIASRKFFSRRTFEFIFLLILASPLLVFIILPLLHISPLPGPAIMATMVLGILTVLWIGCICGSMWT